MGGIHRNDSRMTSWRKERVSKEVAGSSQKLTAFGFTVEQRSNSRTDPTSSVAVQEDTEENVEDDDGDNETMQHALEELTAILTMQITANQPERTSYQHFRLRSVRKYFEYRLYGENQIAASENAAREVWILLPRTIEPKPSVNGLGKLSPYLKGTHAKRESLLSNEDIAEKMKAWIRRQGCQQVKPANSWRSSLAENTEVIDMSMCTISSLPAMYPPHISK